MATISLSQTIPIWGNDPMYGFAEREIGQIALLWNGIQHVVFAYFVGFSRMHVEAAAAAFYSIKADSAQQEMTLKLGTHVLSTSKKPRVRDLASKLKTSFDRIGRFAAQRNSAIHAYWVVNEKGQVILSPDRPVSPASPGFKILERLPAVIEELSSLNRDVRETFDEVATALAWSETLLAP